MCKIHNGSPMARVTTSHNESQRVINVTKADNWTIKPSPSDDPAGGRGFPRATCAGFYTLPLGHNESQASQKRRPSDDPAEGRGFPRTTSVAFYTPAMRHNESQGSQRVTRVNKSPSPAKTLREEEGFRKPLVWFLNIPNGSQQVTSVTKAHPQR